MKPRAALLGLIPDAHDQLEQLKAAMIFYELSTTWCREATAETHSWPTHKPGA